MDARLWRHAAPQSIQSRTRFQTEFGAATAADGVWEFAQSLGAPAMLSALGMKETDLDRAAALMLERPYWNPRPLVAAELRALVDDAFVGRRPAVRRV